MKPLYLFILSLFTALSTGRCEFPFRWIDLGVVSGANGINNSGQAVGFIKTESEISVFHAFLWEEGRFQDLGTLGGSESRAYAINDSGQVVGSSDTAEDNKSHAFLWQNGEMIDLGVLGRNISTAWDINDMGQVVGGSEIENGPGYQHAFLWEHGVMTDLGTLDNSSDFFDSCAYGINDLGQIVGSSDIGQGDQAFIWEDGVMRILENPLGRTAVARAINNAGQVVGEAQLGQNDIHAVLWQPNGQMIDLGSLKWNSYANDINDQGQVVGYYEDTNSQAFIWQDGEMYSLGPYQPSNLVCGAEAINNDGIVAGYCEANGALWIPLTATPPTPAVQWSIFPEGPWAWLDDFVINEMGESTLMLHTPLQTDRFFVRLAFPAGSTIFRGMQMGVESGELSVQYEQVPFQGPEMVYVEGGTFSMGDEWGDGYENAAPVHEVEVSSFYISKFEITSRQMTEVLQWAYHRGHLWANSTEVRPKVAALPGEPSPRTMPGIIPFHVSWTGTTWFGSRFVVDDGKELHPTIRQSVSGNTRPAHKEIAAMAFCNYLSEMEGLEPCYKLEARECNWNANGYRLPTEAEWEYAAKGGQERLKTKYAGSENPDDVAWYDNNSTNPNNPIKDGKGTFPIGQKLPNELGIYDMSGNAWEICWDFYDAGYYSESPQSNPRGPDWGQYHVMRGGSYEDSAVAVRVDSRQASGFDLQPRKGFRVVRTTP